MVRRRGTYLHGRRPSPRRRRRRSTRRARPPPRRMCRRRRATGRKWGAARGRGCRCSRGRACRTPRRSSGLPPQPRPSACCHGPTRRAAWTPRSCSGSRRGAGRAGRARSWRQRGCHQIGGSSEAARARAWCSSSSVTRFDSTDWAWCAGVARVHTRTGCIYVRACVRVRARVCTTMCE